MKRRVRRQDDSADPELRDSGHLERPGPDSRPVLGDRALSEPSRLTEPAGMDRVGFRSSAQEHFQTSMGKSVVATRTNIEASTLGRKKREGNLENDPFLR